MECDYNYIFNSKKLSNKWNLIIIMLNSKKLSNNWNVIITIYSIAKNYRNKNPKQR